MFKQNVCILAKQTFSAKHAQLYEFGPSFHPVKHACCSSLKKMNISTDSQSSGPVYLLLKCLKPV